MIHRLKNFLRSIGLGPKPSIGHKKEAELKKRRNKKIAKIVAKRVKRRKVVIGG